MDWKGLIAMETSRMQVALREAKLERAALLNMLERVGLHLDAVGKALQSNPERVRFSNVPFVLQGTPTVTAGGTDVFADPELLTTGLQGLQGLLTQLKTASDTIAKLEERMK